jgi:apolipoprotein N-acyltransferase
VRKDTTAVANSPDRLSYLWLMIAAALFLFVYGRWSVPLAAWLAPLFLLRFVRTQRPLTGFLIAWAVRFAGGAIVEQRAGSVERA